MGDAPVGQGKLRFRRRKILVQPSYQLDLTAMDNPSTNSYTYTISAYPVNRSRSVRWFYLDQTGTVRAGMGSAGRSSPPAS